MKAFPSLLFLTNRGQLVVYRSAETGHLKVIDSLEPKEGHLKISELVTDQAGSFSNGSPGTSGYESLPLLEELEARSIRAIVAKMEEVLEREDPPSWGFAASPDLNSAVLDKLTEDRKSNLVCNLKLDLTQSPAATIRSRFELECQQSTRNPQLH